MLLLLLINWLHLFLASALTEYLLFGIARFCIPYSIMSNMGETNTAHRNGPWIYPWTVPTSDILMNEFTGHIYSVL